jgi:ribonuclease P/MRP protein subunit RPP1
MKFTDACIFPYPNGDTSIRRMALEARALGFDSVVAVDTPSCEIPGMKVFSGTLIREAPVKDVISRARRDRSGGAVISVQAGDNGFNRAVIGIRSIHILRGIHAAEKNAFDHVAAKMAADNHVAVDLDLSSLVSSRGAARQRAIQRFRDVLVLEQRFEFPVTVSSHARSYLEMRGVREVAGLCSLIGMDADGVAKALAAVDRLMTPEDPPVKVIV